MTEQFSVSPENNQRHPNNVLDLKRYYVFAATDWIGWNCTLPANDNLPELHTMSSSAERRPRKPTTIFRTQMHILRMSLKSLSSETVFHAIIVNMMSVMDFRMGNALDAMRYWIVDFLRQNRRQFNFEWHRFRCGLIQWIRGILESG